MGKVEMGLEEQNSSLESPLIVLEDGHCSNSGFEKGEFLVEVKKQIRLALPLITVHLFLTGLQVISIMYVGHLGKLALSGASMAISFASVTGFTLLIGMSSALDTFCGQSYGAKQYHMLGVHLQRAIIVLLLTTIPISLIWANAAQILVFLGQDPEVSAEAGLYARYMTPGVFAFALFECHGRFLQAQSNVAPMMIISGAVACLHVLVCYVLVFGSGLGARGAALASAVSCWINALAIVAYVRVSKECEGTWRGFSREGFRGVFGFLKLAVPAALMICLEMWSFEMMVLLSGLLPNPKLETSVLSISLNTCTLIYMIPLGLSAATSTRVSNELGAGRPRAARLTIIVALIMIITEGVGMGIVLILGRNVWGHCYSNELEVTRYVGKVLLLVAVCHFLDGIQSVLSGAVRGCGRQKLGAIANLGSYYLLGLPAAIVFAFLFKLGGMGLWIGMIVALFMQALLLMIITLCTNWEAEANKAIESVHSSVNPEKAVS